MLHHQYPKVKGWPIDAETRCEHYHSTLDVIALKFKCCHDYYPCHSCHEKYAGHEARQWGIDERETKAVLCGVCMHELSINEYFNSGNICPSCSAAFNPNCSLHYHLYFQ